MARKTSNEKMLEKLDAGWEETKEEVGDDAGGFSPVPTSNYVVTKLHCELSNYKDGGLCMKRQQTILEGEYTDKVVYELVSMDDTKTPQWRTFFMKWLNLLGYLNISLSKDLLDTFEDINNNSEATYQTTIKENEGYNNVYYNKVLNEGSAPSDEGGESSDEDDQERGEIPDLDEMKKCKLKKLIEEHDLDIDLTDDMDDDDIRDAIEEAWDKPPKEDGSSSSEKSEEPETTKTASRRVASKKDDAEAIEKTSKSNEKLRKAVFKIADVFGIAKVDKDSTLEKLHKEMKVYEFRKKDLNKAEIKTLKEADLENTII